MKKELRHIRNVQPKGTGSLRVCLSLFTTFFKIGAFTFGGGFAMIPLIEREMIDRRGWIARGDFLELLTLAQSAPGPIALNSAVFVGYKIAGYRGAFSAVAGVVLPSFVPGKRSLQPESLLPSRGVAGSGLRPLPNIPHCCLP